MSSKSASKVLPVAFGSSEEAAQALEFVVSLRGPASAAAVQFAALALLAARHFERSGRKPVLTEAVALLLEFDAADDFLRYVSVQELGALTRASRAFMLTTIRSLSLEAGRVLDAARDNAATVLMREHMRRTLGAGDDVEPTGGADDAEAGENLLPVPTV